MYIKYISVKLSKKKICHRKKTRRECVSLQLVSDGQVCTEDQEGQNSIPLPTESAFRKGRTKSKQRNTYTPQVVMRDIK